jgi:hypothetical protein
VIYRVTNALTPRQWANLERWAARCTADKVVEIYVHHDGQDGGSGEGFGELAITPDDKARFWAAHASLGANGVVVLDPDPESQRRTIEMIVIRGDGTVLPGKLVI